MTFHRSIREEQRISFVAGKQYKDLPGNLIDPGLEGRGFSDLRLLKGLAVYGANAAGKTNVLKALTYLTRMVEDSATGLDEGDPTGVEPFALSPEWIKAPSEFVLRFVVEGVRYHFVLVLDRKRILFESLSAFPRGREQVWYERAWDEATQGYSWSPARPPRRASCPVPENRFSLPLQRRRTATSFEMRDNALTGPAKSLQKSPRLRTRRKSLSMEA